MSERACGHKESPPDPELKPVAAQTQILRAARTRVGEDGARSSRAVGVRD